MPLDSSKIIRKVAKDLLWPFNPIRISDRCWSYDGGWYLLHFCFDPSSWSKGAYSDLGIQPLIGWHTYVTLGGVRAPRRYAELKDLASFEAEFGRNVQGLIPIAKNVVEAVQSPRDFFGNYLLLERRTNAFEKGMLLGLAGRKLFARWQFMAAMREDGDRPHIEVARRHAAVALDLLDDERRFQDFADLLILRTRSAIHPIGDRLPARYPWSR